MILLSGTGEVSGLGEYLKLFVGSEGQGLVEKVEGASHGRESPRKPQRVPHPTGGRPHAQAIFETHEGERLMRAMLVRLKDNE